MGIRPISNPTHRFTKQQLEWLEEPPPASVEIFEETAASIIQENKSPDIGFRYSVNPYRGCFHACAYCYARPTHQYIDFGAGTDFDRKIVVKVNAPALLKAQFDKRAWKGETIVFSGVTDCYQPIEAQYAITRQCLELCLKYRNPVGIITKGCLIQRDVDLLVELNRVAAVQVYVSLAFTDDEASKLVEPHAPRPSARFRVMKLLSDAGVPVGVGVAPVIPGLNDSQIPDILAKAREHGAQSAFMTLLRLPQEVREIFIERITEAFPLRHKKILSQLQRMRGGKFNNAEFGNRMVGQGQEWEVIRWLFRSAVEREGLRVSGDDDPRFESGEADPASNFRRPNAQLDMFRDS